MVTLIRVEYNNTPKELKDLVSISHYEIGSVPEILLEGSMGL